MIQINNNCQKYDIPTKNIINIYIDQNLLMLHVLNIHKIRLDIIIGIEIRHEQITRKKLFEQKA